MSNIGLLPAFKNKFIFSNFKHPQSVCMSYYEHCMFSLKLARCFAVGSFKAFVHAFFPNLYITSSSDLLISIKEEMTKIGCHQYEEVKEVDNWTNRGTFVDKTKHEDDIPACFF